jgi:hypothetical protein
MKPVLHAELREHVLPNHVVGFRVYDIGFHYIGL